MSFRDISRRSGSSKGSSKCSSKSTQPKRQLSVGSSESVTRAKELNSFNNLQHSSVTSTSYPTQQNEPSFHSYNTHNTTRDQHITLSQQREQDYALQLMHEREQELQDINQKMHVVNEIYKDLEKVVDQQQDQIDIIENQFGNANHDIQRGLDQLEEANSNANKKSAKKEGEEENLQHEECNFFVLRYIRNKMNSIGKIMSVCGGSATVEYSLEENDR